MSVRMIAEENEYPSGQARTQAAPQPQQYSPEEIAAARAQIAQIIGELNPPPAAAPQVVVKRVMPDREILAALNGLGAVLAVRMMLLLAVVGAFALAWQAMSGGAAIAAIWILGVYAVTIVAPLVWLSTQRT